MELVKLSQFKIQLHALISEFRDLKVRERHASEQLQLMIQNQKLAEEEFNGKLAAVNAELYLSNELSQKLDRKLRWLQNDNDMLESQLKEMKGTINSILESRDSFIKAYEGSTCEMQRAIESRDRKIDILSEKIKAHSMWFASIEKEASSIRQIVDDAHSVLIAREEVVVELRSKVDEVSTLETLFLGRINNLERELRNKELEVRKRDKTILNLEWQLEAANLKRDFQPKIEELQQDLSVKELIIQNLVSQNKELHFEVAALGVLMKKIQDGLSSMSEGDRKIFTSVFEHQENVTIGKEEEALSNIQGLREKGEAQNEKGNIQDKSLVTEETTTLPEFEDGKNSLKKVGELDSFASESVGSSSSESANQELLKIH
ncbi:unnamed protein product [Cuscuta epithymum]|uniref:Uncharacterized protein n=3 Tax=Cuscuta epithymum TaxID=186058 RepID=A0AAV0CXA6_9ASTE|nr:unnamed protein product [Cuscuta epithymum]CAH9146637.1 unnamed protein product [Cuscuta epithymum]